MLRIPQALETRLYIHYRFPLFEHKQIKHWCQLELWPSDQNSLFNDWITLVTKEPRWPNKRSLTLYYMFFLTIPIGLPPVFSARSFSYPWWSRGVLPPACIQRLLGKPLYCGRLEWQSGCDYLI